MQSGESEAPIRFRLDNRSGVPVYRQIVEQVRQAIRLGHLGEGDQLPTVREVCVQIAVNPNTVHHAYRELEHLGLARGRVGQGTFVARAEPAVSDASRTELTEALSQWIDKAESAGLDADGTRALLASVLQERQDKQAREKGSTP